ncbi:MAG: hypothetical protein IPL46_17770 [Saprospiraceae bacterium]|nr:hypothetical protein [Saprospiraceae bacterium]
MKYGLLFSLIYLASTSPAQTQTLKEQIRQNQKFNVVKDKAIEIIKTGFNAGDGYSEVWIRDYNTFIELSAEVLNMMC